METRLTFFVLGFYEELLLRQLGRDERNNCCVTVFSNLLNTAGAEQTHFYMLHFHLMRKDY